MEMHSMSRDSRSGSAGPATATLSASLSSKYHIDVRAEWERGYRTRKLVTVSDSWDKWRISAPWVTQGFGDVNPSHEWLKGFSSIIRLSPRPILSTGDSKCGFFADQNGIILSYIWWKSTKLITCFYHKGLLSGWSISHLHNLMAALAMQTRRGWPWHDRWDREV